MASKSAIRASLATIALCLMGACREKAEANKAPEVTSEPGVPATVTVAWCAKLRERLQERYPSQAAAKYPNRGRSFTDQVVGDYCRNLEYNCQQDVGKPTAGKWQCHWDSSFDTYSQCDQLK